MSIEAMLGLAIATFIFALIPGPGVVTLVAQTIGHGFAHGMSFTAGLVLGDMIYLLLAMLGMGWIASQFGTFFMILKWTGAAYLIWLGIKCLRQVPASPTDTSTTFPKRKGNTFFAGCCVTLGNPKVIAFYCGFLPGFIDMAALDMWSMIEVLLITLLVVLTVLTSYVWLAASGRRATHSTRLWKTATRSAGFVMIGSGILVATE